MTSFFADSYAIIEILKGNRNYLPYRGSRHLLTTEFNICEVAFAVCRDYPASAMDVMDRIRKNIPLTQTTNEDYCSGALLKRSPVNKGKNLSTIDCVGYAVSRRLDIPFLTGDREFETIDNVEFVR